MITKEAAQTCYSEDDSQCELRTPAKHEEQCQLLVGPDCATRSTEYGINRTSILEEVPGFSVVYGLPHDVMHDLFAVADPGFLEGGFWCTIARENLEATPTLGENYAYFDRFLRQTISPTSPIDPFSNEFSSKAF